MVDFNERTPDSRRLHVPRDELMQQAARFLKKHPGAKIYFKYTCEKCGERVTFREPNRLFERGECDACGHDQPVTAGGMMAVL